VWFRRAVAAVVIGVVWVVVRVIEAWDVADYEEEPYE
jgi:hypothetical protein